MGRPLRVGVVGAGKISGQYSATLSRLSSARSSSARSSSARSSSARSSSARSSSARPPRLAVTAVADLDQGRAQRLAARHDGARALALPDLYAADDVDVILNLTTPAQHAEVALAGIAAGKHVYGEKPLAATSADGRAIVAAAAAAGIRAACAPDTVLGTGVQTARAALDAGAIGVPHAATAFMTTPGHERWHPDPEFYYRPGGGPLLDMGPYYLTALVHLLGPVRRVVGMSSRPRDERAIGDGPRAGTTVRVEIDTHVTGILEHDGGALTTMIMSFDTWATHLPSIEVYGSAGTLSVPDPNYFDGDVGRSTQAKGGWTVLAPGAGYAGAGRGVGLLDLAEALAEGRPHLAAADLALHVLDVMESMQTSARTGAAVTIGTTCVRPDGVAGLIDLA